MNSILVLDDDAIFREMVANLLHQRGYNVIQARSVKEATEAFLRHMPQLAIVDYRMPESDGMSWISKLREEGRDTLIVFISALGCDEKTFNWLRNILKVSLIVQKPIVPHVFMAQIEELLPVDGGATAKGESAESLTVESECERLINQFPDSELVRTQTQAIVATLDTQAAMLRQLAQLRKKLEVEKTIKSIKDGYPKELSTQWLSLTQMVRLLKEGSSPDGAQIKQDAVHLSHNIRGTASSLGFNRAGKAARQLEFYLSDLDQVGSSDREALWSAIAEALADGQAAVSGGQSRLAEKAMDFQEQNAGKILLVAKESSLSLLTDSDRKRLPQVVIVSDPIEALEQANNEEFKGAIIDLAELGTTKVIQLITDLRMTNKHEHLPISIVVPGLKIKTDPYFSPESKGRDPFTEMELSYYGCSVVIEHPISRLKIEHAVRELRSSRHTDKPRILFVDDDEILTKFLATILTAEGLDVHTLFEPVRVMEVIEEVDPDMILLDVLMPGLDGFEVCRMLRANPRWTDIPIVFLTSKSSPDAAFEAGATDFLRKPVATNELVTCIKAQLESACQARVRTDRDELTGAMWGGPFRRSCKGIFAETLQNNQIMCLCLMQIDDIADTRSDNGQSPREDVLAKLGTLIQGRFKSNVLRGRWSEMGVALAFTGEDRSSINGAVEMLNKDFELLTFSNGNGNGNGHSPSSEAEPVVHNPKLIFGFAEANEKDGTFEDLWKAAHSDLLNR